MKRKRARRKIFKKSLMLPSEILYNLDDVIEISFILHPSLSYLDLSRRELSKFKKGYNKKRIYYSSRDPVSVRDFVVYTEESCRKRLAPDRKVLYKYHLDVSRDLEVSLRNPENEKNNAKIIQQCYAESVLLFKVNAFTNKLCESYLSSLIIEALEQTSDKIKLISQISKLAKYIDFIPRDRIIRERSLNLLCFQRADSTVVQDFLTVMDFVTDHLYTYSVNVFEFVIHHTNRTGYDFWAGPNSEDPIHTSISYGMFVKAESLFEYRNAPRFCEKTYDFLKDSKKSSLPVGALNLPQENELLTKERHLLILEILRNYRYYPSTGLKALQMMWRSIPDPFINLDELKLTLSTLPKRDIIEKVRSFLQDITGEDVLEESGHRPRKLKHYCRIFIRSVLGNKMQLPSGIIELKLPPSLKSYLRLEY